MARRRVAGQRLLERGGKRRKPNISTSQLSERQCRNIIAATYASIAIGQPFNRFITLLWERSGIDARDNAAATARFVKLVSQWARRRGYRLNWLWVQEWGRINGAHVHLLLHVPPELDDWFGPLPKKWSALCLPKNKYVRKAVDTRKLYPPESRELAVGAYEARLWGKVHYMLKCAPEDLERELGMVGRGQEPWGQSGITFCMRAGIWQGWRTVPLK